MPTASMGKLLIHQTLEEATMVFQSAVSSLCKDNGDGNENVTNLHIQWAKTIALHSLHGHFSFILSISLSSSAK